MRKRWWIIGGAVVVAAAIFGQTSETAATLTAEPTHQPTTQVTKEAPVTPAPVQTVEPKAKVVPNTDALVKTLMEQQGLAVNDASLAEVKTLGQNICSVFEAGGTSSDVVTALSQQPGDKELIGRAAYIGVNAYCSQYLAEMVAG